MSVMCERYQRDTLREKEITTKNIVYVRKNEVSHFEYLLCD